MKKIILATLLVALPTGVFGKDQVAGDQKDKLKNPKTRVYFRDACTKKETGTASPNGTEVVVEINNLDPSLPLRVDLTLAPVKHDTLSIDAPQPKTSRFRSRSHEDHWVKRRGMDSEGKLQWVKTVSFRNGGPFFNTKVHWVQRGRKGDHRESSGEAMSSIYATQDKNERFFLAFNQPRCYWERPSELKSEYKYNSSDSIMRITKTMREQTSLKECHDLSAGLIPPEGGSMTNGHMSPLLGTPQVNFVWLFKSWRTAYSTNTYMIMNQTFVLQPEQGAVFASRERFDRYSVDEFRLKEDPATGCLQWQVDGHGYLDVATRGMGFHVIPVDEATSHDSILNYIEKSMPPADTCKGDGIPSGQAQYFVPEERGEMYFYTHRGELSEKLPEPKAPIDAVPLSVPSVPASVENTEPVGAFHVVEVE